MKRTKKRFLRQEILRHRKRQQKRWDRYHGPISTDGQWFSSEGRILSSEEKYQLGDNSVIMSELSLCLAMGRPIPEWLRIALLRATMRAQLCEVDSWDDVLGPPAVTEAGRPARGKTRLAMRRKQELKFLIYDRVKQAEAEGKPVDRGLFEDIAAGLSIGRAQVEQLYYDNRFMVELTRKSLGEE